MMTVTRAARLRILACSIFFFVTVARADDGVPTRARLEWTREEGAERCIDGPALDEAVSRRWGRRVFVYDSSANVLVKGRIRRNVRGAWAAHFELERSDGTKLGRRDIVSRAADCSALDDSLALALGLMLDLTERPPSAEQSTTTPEPVSGPPITIPKETAAPREPWRVEPSIGAAAAIGLLPGVAFGGRLAIAAEPPHFWRIEAGGTLWQTRQAEHEALGARLSMWTLDIAICPIASEGESLGIWACIAQRAGMVKAEGFGFDRNASPNDTLLAAEARAGASWTFASPWILHASLGLVVPLVRLGFVYRSDPGDLPTIYRMSPVAGVAALGIGARF
jgi:hypothetical protein